MVFNRRTTYAHAASGIMPNSAGVRASSPPAVCGLARVSLSKEGASTGGNSCGGPRAGQGK
eukprot:8732282-Alexandrium_andersonii.AAC.1